MIKKIFIIIIIILIAYIIVKPSNDDNEIRVRVIPNSNNEADIGEKEEVKILVINYLLDNYNDKRENYVSNIENTIETFNESINEEYQVSIFFKNHTFYNKAYNGNGIINTQTLTFLVVIGEGKGDNWWGSIYPKFLEVNGSETVTYKSYFNKLFKKIKGWIL